RDRRAENLQHSQRGRCQSDRFFVARNAAAIVAVIEKARVAPDDFAVERTTLKERSIIRLLVLHNAQHDRNIGHTAAHWTGSVLLMTDRNDAVPRNQTERRFQTENILDRRRPSD